MIKTDTDSGLPTARSLLSFKDIPPGPHDELMKLSRDVANNYDDYSEALNGSRIGLLFNAPSTRTRTSFWRAGVDLGAAIITFGPAELQVITGEAWADTGMVLSEYLDGIVVRTDGPLDEMRQIAQYMPATINALSLEEHPTQAIADYCTIVDSFGSAEGVRLAYFGGGNNTAAALALLMTRFDGVRCDFYSPPGFGLPVDVTEYIRNDSGRGGTLRVFDHIPDSADVVDVVYTTRWESMGKSRTTPGWQALFEPFRVSDELFARFASSDRCIFMHDLPAKRGEEVSSSVLDAPYSRVRHQARHKISAAAASLLWTQGRTTTEG